MKRSLPILATLLLLATQPGCMKERIHQGNVMDANKIAQVGIGDSKFRVESLLGMPMLKSTLHPDRVTYVEDYEDKETGKRVTRGIDITYDEALRVTDVHRFGDWR